MRFIDTAEEEDKILREFENRLSNKKENSSNQENNNASEKHVHDRKKKEKQAKFYEEQNQQGTVNLEELDNQAEELLEGKPSKESLTFDSLGISEEVLHAIKDLGFETPSPIQSKAIGPLLNGLDIIGQAQTGTGKTAAFALPILSKIDTKEHVVQALILLPTRELAIQVAEACTSFAKYIKDFRILPVYGGSSYDKQIHALNRGTQLVVGTPGRIMDLINRGKLDLSHIKYLVLDEADEMLKMGFIDDVEWILSKCPEERQTALFSATMPDVIKRVAKQNLKSPKEIKIASKTATATTVRQRYWLVSGLHKIDALTRLLEVEPYDALLIFTRTKTDAEDLAQKLATRGIACEALHGDIPQKIREKVVDKLRNGQLDVLVATDVVARGLDVDRITHVVNYDIPFDPESYVHRIGRTGRAGKTGDAILFVSPRERRMLRLIEKVTNQPIEPMKMPTKEDINNHRLEKFKENILASMNISEDELMPYKELIDSILADNAVDPAVLCASLARMLNGGKPLLVDESEPEPEQKSIDEYPDRRKRKSFSAEADPLKEFPELKMVRYRIAVGHKNGVKPGQIVGAIANEGAIESRYIGSINIFDSFSTIDLPEGMPSKTIAVLKQAVVCGRPLSIREYYSDDKDSSSKHGGRGGNFRDRNGDRGQGRRHGKDRFGDDLGLNHSRREEPSGKKGRVLRGVPFKFGA